MVSEWSSRASAAWTLGDHPQRYQPFHWSLRAAAVDDRTAPRSGSGLFAGQSVLEAGVGDRGGAGDRRLWLRAVAFNTPDLPDRSTESSIYQGCREDRHDPRKRIGG